MSLKFISRLIGVPELVFLISIVKFYVSSPIPLEKFARAHTYVNTYDSGEAVLFKSAF
tara:strand:- start:580 stop:753 length:174 start_codon:yes stop_codon:yes gene_type:complete